MVINGLTLEVVVYFCWRKCHADFRTGISSFRLLNLDASSCGFRASCLTQLPELIGSANSNM